MNKENMHTRKLFYDYYLKKIDMKMVGLKFNQVAFTKLIMKCCVLITLIIICSCSSIGKEGILSKNSEKLPPLKISDNGRYLVTESGDPVFLNCETAWRMAYHLDTTDIKHYFTKRKEQGFNAVGVVALQPKKRSSVSAYGHPPFERVNDTGLIDPLSPVITDDYDFWDHFDYIVDKAEEMDFYLILLPSWGTQISGSYDGSDTSNIIFNEDNGFKYGRWISNRYRDKSHIIWMLGGDVSAVYGEKDYTDVVRAIAKGIIEGAKEENGDKKNNNKSKSLMSYHPRKAAPNSSEWFHDDSWLDFNSVQDWPEDQIEAITHDYQLKPAKPTWLFEGRYEDYKPEWKDWQVRYQAYQTVFAGGFGHTYGHEMTWGFFDGWETQLDDPGAWQMQHLYKLMTTMDNEQYLNRIPNQELIAGDQGKDERISSTRIQATQCANGSYAFIYSANGRDISVKMELLASEKMDAYWFNPRNGKWDVDGTEYDSPTPFVTDLDSGTGAAPVTFDPPGVPEDENDWVLVIR